MIYLLVFILLLIPVVKYDWMAKTGGEKFWYYMSLVVLILLVGLRYRVGGDTLMYMAMYDEWPSISELKYFDFEEAEYRPLWYILVAVCKSISNDFVVFQILHAIITIPVFFYCFRKYCPRYYFTAILLFYIGYFLYFSIEILREDICIVIMFLAIGWLINKKYLWYYIAIIPALYIHYSALIMLFIPIAYRFFKKPSWKLQVILFVIIFLLLSVINLPAIIVNSLPISGQFSRLILAYIEYEISINGIIIKILNFMPIIGLVFIRQRVEMKDEYDFTPLIMATVVIYAFSICVSGVERFINYFVPFIIIYVVNTIYPILYRKFRDISITYSVAIIVLIVYGFNLTYYYLRDMSDYYPNSKYYVIFYPYHSIFDNKINEKRERFIENYREVQIQF